MIHPDKSDDASEFVRVFSNRLVKEKGYHPFAAVAAGFREWKKSPFRAELMVEYRRRGFGLEESARENAARRARGNNEPTLKVSLFEATNARRK